MKAGDWCDDLPPESIEHLIEKGAVERVHVEGEPAKILTRKTKFKARVKAESAITREESDA